MDYEEYVHHLGELGEVDGDEESGARSGLGHYHCVRTSATLGISDRVTRSARRGSARAMVTVQTENLRQLAAIFKSRDMGAWRRKND